MRLKFSREQLFFSVNISEIRNYYLNKASSPEFLQISAGRMSLSLSPDLSVRNLFLKACVIGRMEASHWSIYCDLIG